MRFERPTLEKPEEKIPEWLEKIKTWFAGEAHTHSIESNRTEKEAFHSIKRLLKYYSLLGLEFAVFSEHASPPAEPYKLDKDDEIVTSIKKESEQIYEINKSKKYQAFALSSAEVSVFFDENNQPQIDLPDETMENLDLVVGSRHVIDHKYDFEKTEQSLDALIKNPHIDVIGHPDRSISFHPHDWNFFCKLNPAAEKIRQEIKALEQDKEKNKPELDKKYKVLKKIIGKTPVEKDDPEEIKELNSDFGQKEKEYLEMWGRLLDNMKADNKAFEINLNNPPVPRLIKMAAKRKIKFFISFDAHGLLRSTKVNLKKLKIEVPKEIDGKKQPRYQAALKLLAMISQLQELGITPDQIVNSSKENMLEFLTKDRDKKTENLELINK